VAAFRNGFHDAGHMGKLLDVVPDLLVQYAPLGDHQHGVKDELLGLRGGEFYELVGKLGERIGLAGACRVLHQIPQARAVLLRIG